MTLRNGTADPPTAADRPDLARLSGSALKETFGELFGTHAAGLRRYLARRVGGACEDLVAETFLVALRERGAYDPARAGVRAWLYGIATNLLRHHVRAEVRALHATARLVGHREVAEPHHDRVAERVDAADRVRRLAGALARLPARDRDVLLLTSWAGLTATEVGEALGIPAGTVRSRLHRTRRALREQAETSVEDTDNA